MNYKDAERILRGLHSSAIKVFRGFDKNVKINRTNWKYKEKGGGQSVELANGKIIEKGKTSEVLNKPKQEFTKELLNCSPKLPKKWF